jgi:hypothetical protein
MRAPNKMMIAVGALALTATTLLAGCGGSSNAASEAPASEAPAVEAPASVFEGTVKPADVSDDDWATASAAGDDDFFKNMDTATPEQLAKVCADGVNIDPAANVQQALALGGNSRGVDAGL